MYTVEQLAYIAGFFDGEGCVSVNENQQGHLYVKATISQNDITPLVMIQELFGGSISNARRCHNLVLTTAKAVAFFEAILPYTVVKRSQIEAALKLRYSKDYLEQCELRAEIKRLKVVS